MTDLDLALPAGLRVPASVSPQATSASGATRTLIRGSSLLLLGRLISLAINFAVQVITVRYLVKSDYGAFAYGMGIVSTGSTAVLLGLDKSASRFIAMFQERSEPRRVMGTIALAVATVWGLGLSLVVVLYGLRATLADRVVTDPVAMSLLLILIALVPVTAFDSLLQRLLAVFVGARAIFFRRHLLGPGLKLAAVLLVVGTGGDVQLLAWGYLIGGLLGVIAYAVVLLRAWQQQGLLRHLTLHPGDVPARAVLLYSLPLLSSELVLVLRDSLSVILLGHMQSSNEVAAFQAVLPAAKLNLIVMQSFSLLFLPLAARLYARGDRQGMNHLYWQTTVWIALVSFPIFAATVSLAQPLVHLLFGPQYASSARVLAVLGVGHYFHASLGFNAMTLRVHDKARYIIGIDAAALVVGLTLNLVLIPRYGALGAAVGTTGTLILHNVLTNIGLTVAGTGVQLIHWRFLRVYGVVAGWALGLFLMQWLAHPPVYLTATLIALTSLLLIRTTRHIVRPGEMFPELLRIPLLGALIAYEPAGAAPHRHERDSGGDR